jgi:hypothetical protein
VTSYADGTPQDQPTEEPSAIPSHIQKFLDTAEANGTWYELTYTADSVVSDYVYMEPGYDELKQQLYFELVFDLPDGYTIYDKEDTPYIDGVKINGEYLATRPYKVYITDPLVNYTVLVKVVYEDSAAGVLAKLQNGDASLLDLFDNPVMLMQIAYYALAVFSIIFGAVIAAKSRKHKSKTSTDIANETVSAVTSAGAATKEELTSAVTSIILDNIAPVLNACVHSNANVVKAIALSNSKSKDAPITLLDVLSDSSNIDITNLLTNLKNEAIAKIESEETERANTLSALQTIAEDVPTVTPTATPIDIVDERTSIF